MHLVISPTPPLPPQVSQSLPLVLAVDPLLQTYDDAARASYQTMWAQAGATASALELKAQVRLLLAVVSAVE